MSEAKVVIVKDGDENESYFSPSTTLRDAVNQAASEAGLSSVIVKTSRDGAPVDSNDGGKTLAALGGTVFIFAKAAGA